MGKKIVLIQQRKWGVYIGHYLAGMLKKEGCYLGAITSKKSTYKFTIEQKEVKYDFILSNDDLVEDPRKYLVDFDCSLGEICQDLGVDSIWPIVSTSRHHTKSYKDKYYFGFKQNVPDEEIINYVKALYKNLKKMFDEFKPDIIIAPNFVTILHMMLYYFAKQKGVKMMAINDSKVYGVYLTVLDPYASEGRLFERFNELENNLVISENTQKARNYISDFRKNFKIPDYSIKINKRKQKSGLFKKIKYNLSPFLYIFRWYSKKHINYISSLGISPDHRPPRIILRDFYSYIRYEKFMNNYDYYNINKVDKFVYFPLQHQPEATIDVRSPFFSNQIETARLVAMSLPDDYTLVVKEHPAMVGLRPPSYIEKIARTPNVKLVDYRIPTEEIIKGSKMVISPGSTTLAESAFLKRPAIQLGNLGTTLLLPNVIKHSNLSTLSKAIKRHLSFDCTTEEYEKKLRNYVATVYDVGIEFDYIKAWEAGSDYKKNILLEFYKKEICYYLGVK